MVECVNLLARGQQLQRQCFDLAARRGVGDEHAIGMKRTEPVARLRRRRTLPPHTGRKGRDQQQALRRHCTAQRRRRLLHHAARQPDDDRRRPREQHGQRFLFDDGLKAAHDDAFLVAPTLRQVVDAQQHARRRLRGAEERQRRLLQKGGVAKQGEGWWERGVRRHGGSNASERRFDFRQGQTRRSLYFGLLHRQIVEGDGHLLKVGGFRRLRQMLKVTQILIATACLFVSLQMFQVD